VLGSFADALVLSRGEEHVVVGEHHRQGVRRTAGQLARAGSRMRVDGTRGLGVGDHRDSVRVEALRFDNRVGSARAIEIPVLTLYKVLFATCVPASARSWPRLSLMPLLLVAFVPVMTFPFTKVLLEVLLLLPPSWLRIWFP